MSTLKGYSTTFPSFSKASTSSLLYALPATYTHIELQLRVQVILDVYIGLTIIHDLQGSLHTCTHAATSFTTYMDCVKIWLHQHEFLHLI